MSDKAEDVTAQGPRGISGDQDPEGRKLQETLDAVDRIRYTYPKSIRAFMRCDFQDIPISHRFYFIQGLSLFLFLAALLTIFYISSDSRDINDEEGGLLHSRKVYFYANDITDQLLSVNRYVVLIMDNDSRQHNFGLLQQRLQELHANFSTLIAGMTRAAASPKEREMITEMQSRFADLDEVYEAFVAAYGSNNTMELLRNTIEISNMSMRFLYVVREVQRPFGHEMHKAQQEDQKIINLGKVLLLVFFLATLAISIFTGLSIRRSMHVDAFHLLHSLKQIARGDLNSKVNISNKNEIGLIAKLTNGFVYNTRHILLRVKHDVMRLNKVITANRKAIDENNKSVAEQKAMVSDVSAATSSLEESIARVTDFAQSTLEEVQNAEAASETCRRTMSDNITTTHTLSDRLRATSQAVENIKEMGDRIDSIVKTIADIADQTNLLALNASIEAARAGDQGRGFAVVADEVRELAIKTASSTKEVSDTILTLSRAVKTSVEVVASCEVEMANSLQQSSKANSSIEEIMGIIATISDMSEQIVESCQTQSHNAANINNSITSMLSLMDSSIAQSAEIYGSLQDLHRLASAQTSILNNFEMDDAEDQTPDRDEGR